MKPSYDTMSLTNRFRKSVSARFSFGGLRSGRASNACSQSATNLSISYPYNVTTDSPQKVRDLRKSLLDPDSILQRSAQDALLGKPYDEIMPAAPAVSAIDQTLQDSAVGTPKPYKIPFFAAGALKRSHTDTCISVPYDQTMPAATPYFGSTYKEYAVNNEDTSQSDEPKPASFGARVRSAAGKATAKIKSLGSMNAAKPSKKAPGKAMEEKSAVLPVTYPQTRYIEGGAGGLHPNPLGCFPDTMEFTERPTGY
jgi:hypothetical protein